MNVVFLGTPDFAVEPLKRLTELKNVNVIAVVCNNDKPFGRKKILTPPPTKAFALEKGIPVFQYDKIRVEGVTDMRNLAPDLMVTCAFGQILSQEILDIPKFGVINIHASLLPKYRGASPINYAILNGETKTGVTIMKTDIGIDTGDIMFSLETDIKKDETCGELFERLSVLGADAIEKAVELITSGSAKFTKQNDGMASYTKMIKKEDAFVDFNDTAINVVNKIRAFNPSPVAYTLLNGEPFKIYRAEIVDNVSSLQDGYGKVLENEKRLVISCKNGAVSLLSVQKSGGKTLNVQEFLNGNKINKYTVFGK